MVSARPVRLEYDLVTDHHPAPWRSSATAGTWLSRPLTTSPEYLMRAKQLNPITLREVPADAEITSHQLLLRAGFYL